MTIECITILNGLSYSVSVVTFDELGRALAVRSFQTLNCLYLAKLSFCNYENIVTLGLHCLATEIKRANGMCKTKSTSD